MGLTRTEKIRLWRMLEQRLLALLALLEDRVVQQDRSNMLRFIDANEYGLAFEQLIFGPREESTALSREEYSEIESIYQLFDGGLLEVDDAIPNSLRMHIRT